MPGLNNPDKLPDPLAIAESYTASTGSLRELELDEFSRQLRGEHCGELDVDLGLGNKELQIYGFKDKITNAVDNNPVTIIVAETGAGKSTQVPQFLHEAGYKRVFVTQPRRAAARNVFSRIKEEIADVKGDSIAEFTVGYQTGGLNDSEGPTDAPIRVVTDGLQLVQELHDKGAQEDDVLIIDEVHEWNSNVEILVAWSKRAIEQNPNMRVVIMSATMESAHIADYYTLPLRQEPPIIKVPGRSFPVEKHEKPNSTVVDEVLHTSIGMLDYMTGELKDECNGILVFMPGKREILDTIDEIKRRLPKMVLEKSKILPLHSKLTEAEQQEAIDVADDCIKIVVSTDVAQTSLTIPDIRYVIDSGYQRRIEIDQEGTLGLRLNPISQADSNQRAGRTGRVSAGTYILTRMNSHTPHVDYAKREYYPMPEMMRSDVARTSLRLRELGIHITQFETLHRASRGIMELAEVNLQLLDAIDDTNEITSIGKQMNIFPLSPSGARMVVESLRYNDQTRAYVAAISASKEAGGLRYFGSSNDRRWQGLSNEQSSDLLMQLDYFIAVQNMSAEEILAHDLDINNVKRATEHYVKICRLLGIEPEALQTPNEQERDNIMRCIYAGHIPSIYKLTESGEYKHAYNGLLPTKREISNRSCVEGSPLVVVGDPYQLEVIRKDEPVKIHILENVSVVDIIALGDVAMSHVSWKTTGFKLREGKMFEKQSQYIFGLMNLGLKREIPANPSEKLRRTVIEEAKKNPGYAQVELRKIKAQIEQLNHRSRIPLRQLTHNTLISLIDEAAEEGITTPSSIEDNLAQMMSEPERGLSLDAHVSPEARRVIEENSPDTLEVENLQLSLTYRKHKVYVKKFNENEVRQLVTDNIVLPDGREVMFIVRNKDGRSKKLTLHDLKYRVD